MRQSSILPVQNQFIFLCGLGVLGEREKKDDHSQFSKASRGFPP
jgi:hypothetical protein